MAVKRFLLDINVWIALLDDDHPHNKQAQNWFAQHQPIATCPLTENGVMRIINAPGYSRLGWIGFDIVRNKLAEICADSDHQFWPDNISLVRDDVLDYTRLSGHNQLTDAYLLALAVQHNGALVTFDQRIGLAAVHGATAEHLFVL
ncbi:MAG: PIN domain-containing protein [Brachymonas sp.]|nr:PIN domain-containing protein [Brachymonas sp.]